MNILNAITNTKTDLSWVKDAFRESWQRKSLKHLIYRLSWELRPMFKYAGKKPLAVDIEASSYCNFRCVFCQQASNWWNEKKISVGQSHMHMDIFKKVVDECARLGVYSMKVNWRGEPTANPLLPAMIYYMKKAGIHEVMMNTNASYFTPQLADDLILAGIDRIIFSCDGISKETYNKIRVGGDFDKFFENVSMFRTRINAHKALGYKTPVVRINCAVMEENAHEIPQFNEKFSGLVDEIRFNTLYNPQMKAKKLGERHRTNKRNGCTQIYQRMIISYDGYAAPCCADYELKLKLGNVMDTSLERMYQNQMGRLRKSHESHNGRSLPGCDKCDLFSLSSKDESGKVIWTDSTSNKDRIGC